MKLKMFVAGAALALLASPAFAADQTWTGTISDAMCGTSHEGMNMDHGRKLSDKECTLACAKGDNSFVFVTGGKVYKLANPTFKGIADHAGESVKLTGEMKGDTITVKSVAAAK